MIFVISEFPKIKSFKFDSKIIVNNKYQKTNIYYLSFFVNPIINKNSK